MSHLHVRPREENDRHNVETFLAERNAVVVARLGRLERALDNPALIAERDGVLAGVLTFVLGDGDCEILTLHATERFAGVGTGLVKAVESLARDAGCDRLWVITTNDNVDALRFYQRRGFRLARLHRGAVDESRPLLKPEIPLIGDHGIDLRDELELEKVPGA
ncbi:MAG TPA: GNAT family N-acetyltransferase [Thermoleophilaceae bacterium]